MASRDSLRDSGSNLFTSSEAWICKMMQKSCKIAAPVGLPWVLLCDLRGGKGGSDLLALNIHEIAYQFAPAGSICPLSLPMCIHLVTTKFICSSAPLCGSRLRSIARRIEKCRLTASQGWQSFLRSRAPNTGDCYLTSCGLSHHPPFQFLHPKRTFGMFTFFVAQPLRFFSASHFSLANPCWLVLFVGIAFVGSTLSFFWSTCQWCLGKPSGFGRKTK